jgi:hypothetical protein
MDAETYLRDLSRKRLEYVDEAPEGWASARASQSMTELNGAAQALVATGGIEEHVAVSQIVREFSKALEERGLLRSVSVGSSFGSALARKGSAPSEPSVLRSRESQSVIERVIPVVGDLGVHDGHRLMVISVERWTSYLTVRFLSVRPTWPSKGERGTGWRFGFEVEDEIGTRYVRVGSSGHGGGRLFLSEWEFQPLPPPGVNVLTLIAKLLSRSDDPRRFPREQLGDEVARLQVPMQR